MKKAMEFWAIGNKEGYLRGRKFTPLSGSNSGDGILLFGSYQSAIRWLEWHHERNSIGLSPIKMKVKEAR